MRRTYFHSAPVRLGPGSIIMPGNWGRMIRTYRPPGNGLQQWGDPWLLARELVFDQIRREVRPEAPSRFEAAFVIEDEQAARRYRDQNAPFGVPHVVEIVDEAMPRHEGALGCIVTQVAAFIDTTRASAAVYWSGQVAGDMEVVTASSLRVIEPLSW